MCGDASAPIQLAPPPMVAPGILLFVDEPSCLPEQTVQIVAAPHSYSGITGGIKTRIGRGGIQSDGGGIVAISVP